MKNFYKYILKSKATYYRLFLSLSILFLWGVSSRYMPYIIHNIHVEAIIDFVLLLFAYYIIYKIMLIDFYEKQ